VRLGGGVDDRRRPLGEGGGEERVLGPHHRWLVHEDPGRPQPLGRSGELDPDLASDHRAEIAEGIEMGVQPAAADRVPAGRWHPSLAEPREQGARGQEGGANPARCPLVDVLAVDRVRLEAELVVGDPVHAHPEPVEEGEHRLDVANPRHVADHQLLLGEQAGGEDRQGRVLVARRHDLARQRGAALDDELLHGD
jgi:hypothetical protein